MNNDYIPNRDNDFVTWINAFLSYAGTNMAALGLVATDMTTLGSTVASCSSALSLQATADKAARAATQSKRSARMATEKVIRRYGKDLRNRPIVTDAQLAGLGLKVRTAATTLAAKTVVAAVLRPTATIDNGRLLIHSLRFAQEGQSTSKAKPQGIKGCEVWSCVLPAGSVAPADESGMRYLDTPSSGPLLLTFMAADAGKIAWYRLRWVANDGSKGEWSNMASAMIMG